MSKPLFLIGRCFLPPDSRRCENLSGSLNYFHEARLRFFGIILRNELVYVSNGNNFAFRRSLAISGSVRAFIPCNGAIYGVVDGGDLHLMDPDWSFYCHRL